MRQRTRVAIRTAALLAVIWFLVGLIEIIRAGDSGLGTSVSGMVLWLVPVGFVAAAVWLVVRRHDSKGKTVL